MPGSDEKVPTPTLKELVLASLWMGCVGFGGGLSVLANVERMVVETKRWMSEREFLNAAVISQMLPGGAAANALACVGLRFHGVWGAALTYGGFAAPGVLAVLVLAWAYMRFGAVPSADAFLSGLNAAVTGIIVAITVRMSRTGIARLWQMAVAGAALLLSLVGSASSLEVILMGIAAGFAWELGIQRARAYRRHRRWRPAPPVTMPEAGHTLSEVSTGRGRPLKSVSPWVLLQGQIILERFGGPVLMLGLVFFRMGLGAYGGGFAIIPALHTEMRLHDWVTERQFADAVAVGQLTPGTVLKMATFLGFVQGGLAGALVATVSILAGPFILVVLLASYLEKVRSKRWVRAALRGLTPSVVGLMAAAAIMLGRSLQTGPGVGAGIAIAAAVALTLVRFEKVNPVLMLAVGGVVRVALTWAVGI